MRLVFSFRIAPSLALLACLWVGQAAAQPPDVLQSYRIVPSQSAVIQTGGFAGTYMEFHVSGTFDLVTGYDPRVACPLCLVPYAKVTDVDAWMIPDSPLTYVQDLDRTLNLSGLDGTWDVPSFLHFSGLEGQDQPIELDAVRYDRSLRMIGASTPGCCDMFQYTVDLYARQVPFADFNADGSVDTDDYSMWRKTFGTTVAPAEGADANADGVIDAADYTVWRSAYDQALAASGATAAATAVPEPQVLVLLLAGLVFLAAGRRRAK